jgi:hypothetical protein
MMRLAGHVSPEMTTYYTHLGNDDVAEAVARIEAANPSLVQLLGI